MATYRDHLPQQEGTGVVMETPTWRATGATPAEVIAAVCRRAGAA